MIIGVGSVPLITSYCAGLSAPKYKSYLKDPLAPPWLMETPPVSESEAESEHEDMIIKDEEKDSDSDCDSVSWASSWGTGPPSETSEV